MEANEEISKELNSDSNIDVETNEDCGQIVVDDEEALDELLESGVEPSEEVPRKVREAVTDGASSTGKIRKSMRLKKRLEQMVVASDLSRDDSSLQQVCLWPLLSHVFLMRFSHCNILSGMCFHFSDIETKLAFSWIIFTAQCALVFVFDSLISAREQLGFKWRSNSWPKCSFLS